MRIISGKFKGKTLYLAKNKKTRPLKDMVKESIFNLLKHSNKFSFNFENSNILDLYAGTGSFGLESLSREAAKVCFVEEDSEALKVLEKNIEKLNLKNNTKVLNSNVLEFIKKEKHMLNFDLIFCDPPYKNKNIKNLLDLIYKSNLLQKNGILIIHRNKKTKETFSNNFRIIEERIYGISKIYFGKFLS